MAGTIHDVLKEYLLSLDTSSLLTRLWVGKDELTSHLVTWLVPLKTATTHSLWTQCLTCTHQTQRLNRGWFKINHMTFAARQRESLLWKPHYTITGLLTGLNVWRDRNHTTRIEGGTNWFIRSRDVIGVSQRTSPGLKTLPEPVQGQQLRYCDAIRIPHNHAMMHFYTVFTMINTDHPRFTQVS